MIPYLSHYYAYKIFECLGLRNRASVLYLDKGHLFLDSARVNIFLLGSLDG